MPEAASGETLLSLRTYEQICLLVETMSYAVAKRSRPRATTAFKLRRSQRRRRRERRSIQPLLPLLLRPVRPPALHHRKSCLPLIAHCFNGVATLPHLLLPLVHSATLSQPRGAQRKKPVMSSLARTWMTTTFRERPLYALVCFCQSSACFGPSPRCPPLDPV